MLALETCNLAGIFAGILLHEKNNYSFNGKMLIIVLIRSLHLRAVTDLDTQKMLETQGSHR